MDKKDFTFEGCCSVYLQGPQALWLQNIDNNSIHYTIGSQSSPFFIQDNRKAPNETAKKIIQGETIDDFSEVFNLPAVVHLKANKKNVEIVMDDCDDQSLGESFTLWMGVTEGDTMPANQVYWYRLSKMNDDRTAFTVLVP